MKKLILISALFLLNFTFTNAQSADETKVAEALATLRQAMLIESLVSNNSDFKTMDLTEQTVKIVGKNAIVRHKLFAETANKGVASTAKLYVLLIFTKVRGNWVLLARQAAKIV
jgi:hypothetical protein